jgi:DNA modification methylase
MAKVELTATEKREILGCLEEGKPLDDKFRFLLFGDKREVELVWNGKTSEVCNVVLPFQVIEQVDEPRGEKKKKGETDSLFSLDGRGRQIKGWTNKLIWGDNKLILSSLKNGPMRETIEKQGGIKLIYIDPPFDVGADFSMDIEIGDETFTKEPNILEEIAYRDTWGRGADSFIAMIYERLSLMRDLLAEDGSIYVHCDWRVNGHIRLVLDELFGNNNFRNEVIWQKIRSSKAQSASFGNVQDSIYFYSKGTDPIFNTQRTPHSEEYIESHYRYIDEKTGKKYRLDNFTQAGQGPVRRFGKRELAPPPGKHWIWSQERIDEGMKDNLIVFSKEDMPSVKRFLDEVGGNVIEDIWTDISPINSMSNERVSYPTQKPEALIERIINVSSNEGDIVADFFCGSGTTLAVAEKLGRKWIGSDLGKFAVHTTRKRLIQVQRQLKSDGKDYRAFEILNLGKYERQHYIGVNVNLREEQQAKQLQEKERAFTDLILYAYRAEKVENFACFVGKKAGRLVAVGPINLPVTRLYVEEVILECRQKHITKVDILAFEFEMGLFPAIQEEAKAKGIDLAMKYIPREVFDKRAVDKDEVVFHNVSYIEVTPRYKGKKIAVELTDFSVFYSQDTVKNAAAGLKEGKTKIVVENGKIIKVSKSKIGEIKKEILTKSWTDWIDYWSVDFNFESKREIIRVKDPETGEVSEQWTGDFVFENEWQSFRTKKDRTLELKSAEYEYEKGKRYKIAVKVVDIFGNDTMKIIEVGV